MTIINPVTGKTFENNDLAALYLPNTYQLNIFGDTISLIEKRTGNFKYLLSDILNQLNSGPFQVLPDISYIMTVAYKIYGESSFLGTGTVNLAFENSTNNQAKVLRNGTFTNTTIFEGAYKNFGIDSSLDISLSDTTQEYSFCIMISTEINITPLHIP
jgi:hypothetical protein